MLKHESPEGISVAPDVVGIALRPQSDGESVHDRYTRAVKGFRDSHAELGEQLIRLGLDRPTRPGHLHKIIDEEFEAALDQFDDAALQLFQAAKACSQQRISPSN